MAVTFLAMIRGFRIPDGIFCHYPALQLDPLRFYPSHLLAIDEELINQSFLQFALACFTRNGGNPDKSCILSPMQAPDAMLRLLPPCKFMMAENDCLRDHSIEMGMRMLKLGKYCKLILMRDFIHGFHNFDTNFMGIDEYRRGTYTTIEHFTSLFNYIAMLKDREEQSLQRKITQVSFDSQK